jgi:hypothetical protein
MAGVRSGSVTCGAATVFHAAAARFWKSCADNSSSSGGSMAIGLRMDFATLRLADYDAVCEALNFPSDWPEGLLAHGSRDVDGTLRVYDVWESRAQFDEFVANRLGAAQGQALRERAEQPVVIEEPLHTFYAR